jgi:hypothetical protein
LDNITPLTRSAAAQVAFTRLELDRILSLYGRMVAAGHWRDYALDLGVKTASFSASDFVDSPQYGIHFEHSEEPCTGINGADVQSYATGAKK